MTGGSKRAITIPPSIMPILSTEYQFQSFREQLYRISPVCCPSQSNATFAYFCAIASSKRRKVIIVCSARNKARTESLETEFTITTERIEERFRDIINFRLKYCRFMLSLLLHFFEEF